jgi:DNA adenine methylase
VASDSLIDRSVRTLTVARVQPMRPFLKWAGAKTKLVAAIRGAAPREPRRLIEPFVGSGAVALNLACAANLLADSNGDLIDVYAELQRDGEQFITDCEKLFTPENNSASGYYALRTEFNATVDRQRKACLFIYLNRHGYNGLCRYNTRGGFNVPFGRYVRPRLPRAAMLAFQAVLRNCTLLCADFREVLAKAGQGDLVYCDPPYVPASATANFTAYAKGGFSAQDQVELASDCRAAAERGAHVLISNHDTPETRALYANADECHELLVPRRISCHAATRTRARELLVVYRPVTIAKAV